MNILFKRSLNLRQIWSRIKQINSNSLNKNKNNIFIKLLSCGILTYSIFHLHPFLKHTQCISQPQPTSQAVQPSSSSKIQIYILNKPQLITQLTQIQEQSILIGFNKYFKNDNKKQFQEKLAKIYTQAKKLNIQKIYLIDKNHIKQLVEFQKMLKQGKKNNNKEDKINNSNRQSSKVLQQQQQQQSQKQQVQQQYDSKSKQLQYYFLTPQFPSRSFKLQSQSSLFQQIEQIRHYTISINPSLQQQLFYPYNKIFNNNIIIKQCPDYVANLKQNKCVDGFKNNVAALIEQKMLRGKLKQFRFMVIMPNSKKDLTPIIEFKKQLMKKEEEINNKQNKQNKQYKQNKQSNQYLPQYEQILFNPSQLSQKQQNMFIFRNDLLGRSINSYKQYNKQNYQLNRRLSEYQRFLLFIKPRIFIISRRNSSIDLYWYITCINRNKLPSISISNTDSFNLGQFLPVTDGHSYPNNYYLQFISFLYNKHPQLNYVIINTQTVSQLIRHLYIKNKFVLYNLTNQIQYKKMFMENLQMDKTIEENYKEKYQKQIQNFINGKNQQTDSIVMDKEHKVDRLILEKIIEKCNKQKQNNNNNNNNFILRVCNLKCQNDIKQHKLNQAYKKIFNNYQNQQNNTSNQSQNRQQNWRNQIYRRTYWIDSHYHNVGLQTNQDYIYKNGKFQYL